MLGGDDNVGDMEYIPIAASLPSSPSLPTSDNNRSPKNVGGDAARSVRYEGLRSRGTRVESRINDGIRSKAVAIYREE